MVSKLNATAKILLAGLISVFLCSGNVNGAVGRVTMLQ